MRTAAGLLVALACASLAAADLEIDSSILVSGIGDYQITGGTSRCLAMVNRAKQLTATQLMFVPTLFWVSEDRPADATYNSQLNVSYYCYNRYQGSCGSPTCCDPATQAQMQQFQSSMATCFQAAISAGLNIAISPHLDDGLGYGGWRNGLLMNPVENYGGFTYQDFMLNPLADALNQALGSNTKVDFSLQGEMSATVVYYPNEYIGLLPTLKARISSGRGVSSNVRVGVSTNFDKICGCVLQDLTDPAQYLSLYPAAFAPLKPQFDLEAIQSLYSQVDFIGISSYASLQPGFPISGIESATYQFDQEIASFGVNLKDLIFNKGKKLYFNEYGVGGGTNQNGMVKATTEAETAASPFFGIFGQYTAAMDPWGLTDPSNPTPPREYLFEFYNKTIEYLNSGGASNQEACPGCQYRIDGLYLWNSASWDLQAIYPESTSEQGSYYDPVLVPQIEAHNAAVSGASTPSGPLPSSSTGSAGTPGVTGVSGNSVGTGVASNSAGRRLRAAAE